MSGLICGVQFCGGKLSFSEGDSVGVCEVCKNRVNFNRIQNDILIPKRPLRKAFQRNAPEPQLYKKYK
jgi:hypothetical protein